MALWREALLAQKVLLGETRGYRHHPQLARFRAQRDPVKAIGAYLRVVADEAKSRGYAFDVSKIARRGKCAPIPCTDGQLAYEWKHLRAKLAVRDPERFAKTRARELPLPNPLFVVVKGSVENWEKR